MFPWEYNPDLELRCRRPSTRSFFSDEMTKDLFIVLSVHAFSLLVLLQPGDWAEDLGYVAEDQVLLMGNDNDFVVKYSDHDKDCVAVDVIDDDNEDV